LKSLDRAFENLASIPLEFIEYKGLIEMAEPRVVNLAKYEAHLTTQFRQTLAMLVELQERR
jgi:hypothetical protein